ncbi:MAG: fibronectin type III domain-containing protein [Gammaproteobacteria bacterium]
MAIKILFGLVGVAPTDRGTADITDITKTAHTISGLCSGGVYKVGVAAWNGIVQGDASETTTSVATDAPQNLKVTAGIHTLGVRWDAPAAGEAVRSYRLRWGKDPEFAPQDIAHLDAATTARTIAGLEAKIAYYVQVDAATSAGDGVCSATAKTRTKEFAFTLDVNDDGAENAHDGILISRYLLGVRGEALIHGQTDNSAETVQKIIEEGMKNDKLKVITTDEDGKGPQWEDGIEVAKFLLGISPKTEEAAEKIRALSGQPGD